MIDRETAKAVAEDMRSALEHVFRTHGLDSEGFKLRTTYGGTLKFTLEVGELVAGENGVNLGSAEALAWKKHAAWASYAGERLDPEALGRTVEISGRPMVFVGYNPRARKMPFLFRDPVADKTFKVGEYAARHLTLAA
jgi:hypothetical protein